MKEYKREIRQQFDVFEDLKTLSMKVERLSGFVQNDFNLLIADGMSKDDLIKSITEADNLFSEVIDDLNSLKQDTIDVLSFYSDKQ